MVIGRVPVSKIFIEQKSIEPKVQKREYTNLFLGDTYLNRRRLILLSFSLTCLVLIIGGFLYWYSEQLAEQRLQDYIGRLTDEGFTIEEHSLADFHVDAKVRIHFFGDFRSYAKQQGINHMYFDRGIHGLYFLNPIGDRVEANIFYYK